LLCAKLSRHACLRALHHNYGQGNPSELKKDIRLLAKEFKKQWLFGDRRSDLGSIEKEFRMIERAYSKTTPDPIRF